MWYEMQAFHALAEHANQICPPDIGCNCPRKRNGKKRRAAGIKFYSNRDQCAVRQALLDRWRGSQFREALQSLWIIRGKDRKYPWGTAEDKDQSTPDFANYDETQIDSTSAVGGFPGGAVAVWLRRAFRQCLGMDAQPV